MISKEQESELIKCNQLETGMQQLIDRHASKKLTSQEFRDKFDAIMSGSGLTEDQFNSYINSKLLEKRTHNV